MPRPLPHTRAWNIAFRTAHIGVAGILLGGHVFRIGQERLSTWLYLTIASGACLTLIEAYPNWSWFHQGRGVLLLCKLLLLCAIPWLWEYRIPILALVVVIASVGSHMPGRFRYYSIIHRRVLDQPRSRAVPTASIQGEAGDEAG